MLRYTPDGWFRLLLSQRWLLDNFVLFHDSLNNLRTRYDIPKSIHKHRPVLLNSTTQIKCPINGFKAKPVWPVTWELLLDDSLARLVHFEH